MQLLRIRILAVTLALALPAAAWADDLNQATLRVVGDDREQAIEHEGFNVAELEEMDIQRAGETIAEIDHVLADDQGRVVAVVISYGRTLGLGAKQAVMPIDRLKPGPYGHATTEMSVEELQALPAWEK